ncbi:MAG: DUF6261 family protein [Tannerella sp.]|jgi:hypothetical protein|nr:DUF6261 family protein [Tannerella sp.]
MKILTINFSYLRNEGHYQFLLLLKKLFETFPGVATIVSALLQKFYPLLTTEGMLVDSVRSSEYTKQIADTDKRLDHALAGLMMIVNASLHHPDPNCVKAAERLEKRLKAFRSSIEKKAYEEESAAVKILVADLQGSYAQQVSTLGLGVWVSEIATTQATFEQLFLLRSAERAAKPDDKMKDVRRQIEAVYRQIKTHIEAYTFLNGEGTTGTFIRRLNEEITYFREHNEHHRTPKDISLTTVVTIADQPFRGRPVTPLPIVMYKDHELVFAFDYDLTYHNNDRPGNAAVTLHGKGAWKDKKTVSFTIIQP